MNLDSLIEIQKLDTKNTLGSIGALADQMKQAWDEVSVMEIPEHFASAKNIVVAGMGGSALGARIIHSLHADSLRTPFEVVNGYQLPHYVGAETLMIISSYSGTTEETIKNLDEAIAKGAKVFVLAAGGELRERMIEHSLSGYIFEPKFNPSGQPRLSLGYSTVAIIALLSKLQFITVTAEAMLEAIETVKKTSGSCSVETPENSNIAKRLAKEIKGHMPILVASEHLVGTAHAVKNQLNESSKNFSALFDIPELNHHLLEGLKNPTAARELFKFVTFESVLYSERVQKRFVVTRDVISKNNVAAVSYTLLSSKKLDQAFELLTIGSYTSFYLAMLQSVDPSQIPWVDYFKEQMGH